MKKNSPKVAIYCQLAKKDFWEMRKQKQELRQFAKNLGYDDFSIYVDNGYSGLTLDRPAFSKLDKAVRNGEIDTIIMRDFSRIGRNYVVIGEWLESIKNLDVDLLYFQNCVENQLQISVLFQL